MKSSIFSICWEKTYSFLLYTLMEAIYRNLLDVLYFSSWVFASRPDQGRDPTTWLQSVSQVSSKEIHEHVTNRLAEVKGNDKTWKRCTLSQIQAKIALLNLKMLFTPPGHPGGSAQCPYAHWWMHTCTVSVSFLPPSLAVPVRLSCVRSWTCFWSKYLFKRRKSSKFQVFFIFSSSGHFLLSPKSIKYKWWTSPVRRKQEAEEALALPLMPNMKFSGLISLCTMPWQGSRELYASFWPWNGDILCAWGLARRWAPPSLAL